MRSRWTDLLWRDFKVGVAGLLSTDSRLVRAVLPPPTDPNGGPA